MIPRGALLQAMESEGFSPQEQGRLLRAVDALMADSTEAIGGGVSAEEATTRNYRCRTSGYEFGVTGSHTMADICPWHGSADCLSTPWNERGAA